MVDLDTRADEHRIGNGQEIEEEMAREVGIKVFRFFEPKDWLSYSEEISRLAHETKVWYTMQGLPKLRRAHSPMAKAIETTALARQVVSPDSGIDALRCKTGWLGELALLWGGTPIGWSCTHPIVWNHHVKDFYGPITDTQPHGGHVAFYQVNTKGKFDAFSCISTNVDGMHQRSSAKSSQVAEVHGSIFKCGCMKCNSKLPSILTSDQDSLFGHKSPLDPNQQLCCTECGGLMRPDITLYSEYLPQEEWKKAIGMLRKPGRGGVFLMVGAGSLSYPASSLPEKAAKEGVTVVIQF